MSQVVLDIIGAERVFPRLQNRVRSNIYFNLSTGKNSWVSFYYDFGKRRIHGVVLNVAERSRKKGLGRQFVEVMEDFGREIGCRRIIFDEVTNPDFWEHFGYYNVLGKYWGKQLS